MTVTIEKSHISGSVIAPPSKSMAHRHIICAALTGQSCRIENVAMSEDIKATVNSLKALGIEFKYDDGALEVDGHGIFTKTDTLFCNESGSTLRFLIPVCLVANKRITLEGSARLFERSLEVYSELCKSHGFEFIKKGNSVTVCGALKSGCYELRGDISSQFISGMLFALSLVDGESEIKLLGNVESLPYIDMTVAVLKKYGARTERNGRIIKIVGGKLLPTNEKIEGDMSNAAPFEALAVLGHGVTVSGVNKNTLQGDKVFYDYFEKLKNGTPTLDVSDCPDLAPILMAVAAAKNGCTLVGTHRLKIKESDRGAAMKEELEKLGAKVSLNENEITVTGKITCPEVEILSHNDHRIVMACAVLLTLTGGKIKGAEAVNKSFPDFFEKLEKIGARITYEA